MNKILVYTFIAILLGTVTMLVPLAVLEPSSPLLANDDSVSALDSGGDKLDRDGMLTDSEFSDTTPVPSDSSGISPQEPELLDSTFNEIGASSGLSSIGLMIVPSFLIALGAFVYLKKRMV